MMPPLGGGVGKTIWLREQLSSGHFEQGIWISALSAL
jgi:hypothetical protein